MSVAAIVLAAGASRRLGQPKQLLQVNGEMLLERAVRLANEAGTAPIIAVLGANYDAILASASLASAIAVHNEQWPTGIASSIRAGFDAVARTIPNCDGVMLLVCDQPKLTAEHLRVLMHEFPSRNGATIVASSYAGAFGVPAIFPRSTFQHLQRLEGDQGARLLLRNPPCELIAIEFQGGEIDIDHPEDLAQLD